MISLGNSPGMTLQKGYSIRLEKGHRRFHHICLGLSWGNAALSEGFPKISGPAPHTHLDGGVTTFARGRAFETICFRKLRSRDSAINHSADESSRDKLGNSVDQEVITIDLPMVNPAVDTIYLYLNSFRGQDFSTIPYSQVRLYKGGLRNFGESLANFHVSREEGYRGYVSMVLGKLERHATEWSFTAIGHPIPALDIPSITRYLEKKVHKGLT